MITIYETSIWIEACAIQGYLRKVCINATVTTEWHGTQPVYGVVVPATQADDACDAIIEPQVTPVISQRREMSILVADAPEDIDNWPSFNELFEDAN